MTLPIQSQRSIQICLLPLPSKRWSDIRSLPERAIAQHFQLVLSSLTLTLLSTYQKQKS
jgi:hypothetical protein